jgi:hypothetical protein
LVIDGNTSFVLERLTDATLDKICIEFRKEKSVQWSLTLLDGIKVEVITHLIYSPKKIVCK